MESSVRYEANCEVAAKPLLVSGLMVDDREWQRTTFAAGHALEKRTFADFAERQTAVAPRKLVSTADSLAKLNPRDGAASLLGNSGFAQARIPVCFGESHVLRICGVLLGCSASPP